MIKSTYKLRFMFTYILCNIFIFSRWDIKKKCEPNLKDIGM